MLWHLDRRRTTGFAVKVKTLILAWQVCRTG